MRRFQVIQLVLSVIAGVASLTVLFTLGSPASDRAMVVGNLALASYCIMRAWEVRHTHPRLRMLLAGTAGLSWFLVLLSVWLSRSK